MSTAAQPSAMGCPACAAAPSQASAALHAQAEPGPSSLPLRRLEVSLPEIHCAACISGVERTLDAMPGVAASRVNLTLKRVSVTAEDAPGTEARVLDALKSAGYAARPLDSAALEATRTDAQGRALLARIAVAGFALMNVMLLSVSVWSGASDSTRDLMHWISALIAIPALAFAAQPFFSNAWRALASGRLDMDVPISTAILLALGVSLWETMQSGEHAFFDAALMLTFFLLIGRYLAHLTRASARSAAAELAALEVHVAERVAADGRRETVPLDAIRLGDLVAVAPGGRIPVDGTVTEGRSEIDPALLTGETTPEPVAPGSALSAGMMNMSGPLVLQVTAIGEDTLLKQIGALVETAERSRSRYASLAERASQYYSHVVNVLAVAALVGWGVLGGDWRVAVNIAAAVLIITCPCALGLAVPAVLTAASGRLFRKGVLLKDGDAFERLAGIDRVVFDKTGTLTTGHPRLVDADGLPPETLALAAGLARGSAHPFSRAIMRAADARGIAPAAVAAVTEHPGLGTEGHLDGQTVRLGRTEWAGPSGPEPDAATISWLRRDGSAPIPLRFAEEIRPEAHETVARLRAGGLSVTLLSGDASGPVAALAAAAGIEDWRAGATPQEKVAELEAMAEEGERVLMVGDGLNDAAALAAAQVSMSPASAVDASRSASDVILLGDRIDHVVDAWDLAKTAHRRVMQNFVLAFAYNIVTVPLAFAGFVTPLIAAVSMSASSIVVALNAMRLGRAA